MLLGLGNDLLDMRRVEKAMRRHEARFITRCFTEGEREIAEQRRPGGGHIAAYAKRFCAKEACAKALGTGIAGGVALKDIEILRSPEGRPFVLLHGGALARLNSILPAGTKPRIHITLTDEPPLAQAIVIIEAIAI